MPRPFGRRPYVARYRPTFKDRLQDIASAIAIGSAITVGLFWAENASGHDWYGIECCSDRDCSPVASTAVGITAQGYRILRNGEIIPFDDRRVKPSPDGEYHICQIPEKPHTRLICLYAPEFGS